MEADAEVVEVEVVEVEVEVVEVVVETRLGGLRVVVSDSSEVNSEAPRERGDGGEGERVEENMEE